MTSSLAAPDFSKGGPALTFPHKEITMTDVENAINDALSEALGGDTGLAERSAVVDFAHRWNSIAPAHLQKTPDEIEAGFNLPLQEIADRLGLDVNQVEEFMGGNPDDDIEIPPTATHGFDDTFGHPAA